MSWTWAIPLMAIVIRAPQGTMPLSCSPPPHTLIFSPVIYAAPSETRKPHRARDVFRLTDATEGHVFRDFLDGVDAAHRLDQAVSHFGFDDSGRDDIDANAVVADFPGEGQREGLHRCLAHVITARRRRRSPRWRRFEIMMMSPRGRFFISGSTIWANEVRCEGVPRE